MAAKTAALETLRATYSSIVDLAEKVRSDRRFRQPEDWSPAEMAEWRELGETATRQSHLRQLTREVLTEWNEGVGAAVEEFWRLVDEQGLDVQRKQDIVADTLARGRVLNPAHFDELADHLEELRATGKVTAEEAAALTRMLDAFETDPRSFEWVSAR